MKKPTNYRFSYILLTIMVLLAMAITPKPLYAWSAITVELESTNPVVRLWNIFRDVISSFTGKESPQVVISDKGTHQLMMKLAYQMLEKDPAYIAQKDYFPAIDGILEWEGVVAKTDRVILEGGEWRGRKAKSGGPDAAGKSKDSYHYYNPRTGKGNADTAVGTYFEDLLMQMYGQGDFYSRGKPNDDMNHDAAWAAHYLGDVYVPYHTVGAFAGDLSAGVLTPAEAGPEFLYSPYECRLTDESMNCDSMDKPPEWNGLNNDFSDIYSYFKRYRSNPDKDWFDPWYYNGIKGLGPNTVLGSHQLWESWAHGYIVDGNLSTVPSAYSKDWRNAAPEFNKSLSHIENQAEQAKNFTLAAVNNDTKNNLAKYTKSPDVAFNKATERVATLWRASLTALRPELTVVPDGSNANSLRVTATVNSVETNDPAIKVRAKLTVKGGSIRGNAIHDTYDSTTTVSGKPVPGSSSAGAAEKTVTVTPVKPWVTVWTVDSNDPDNCEVRLEVIGEYQNTPDLQYAVCEYSRPLSVTVIPDRAKPESPVTLTIKVKTPQKVELEIQDNDLFKSARGNLKRDKDGKYRVSTKNNGEFTGDFVINPDAASGRYEIKVSAPALVRNGAAYLSIGSEYNRCSIELFTHMGGRYYDGKTTSDIDAGTSIVTGFKNHFEGGFTGNVFEGDLMPLQGQSGDGKVGITVERSKEGTIAAIVDYSAQAEYESTGDGRYSATQYYLRGQAIPDAKPDAHGRDWITAKITGVGACNDLKKYITNNKVRKEGTMIWTYDKPVCDANSYIEIRFFGTDY